MIEKANSNAELVLCDACWSAACCCSRSRVAAAAVAAFRIPIERKVIDATIHTCNVACLNHARCLESTLMVYRTVENPGLYLTLQSAVHSQDASSYKTRRRR